MAYEHPPSAKSHDTSAGISVVVLGRFGLVLYHDFGTYSVALDEGDG